MASEVQQLVGILPPIVIGALLAKVAALLAPPSATPRRGLATCRSSLCDRTRWRRACPGELSAIAGSADASAWGGE